MPLTSGFFDPKERERHFISHGSDFGALDAAEYEQIADAFLGAVSYTHLDVYKRQVQYAEITLSAGVVLWKGQEFAPVYTAVRQAAAGFGIQVHWICLLYTSRTATDTAWTPMAFISCNWARTAGK